MNVEQREGQHADAVREEQRRAALQRRYDEMVAEITGRMEKNLCTEAEHYAAVTATAVALGISI